MKKNLTTEQVKKHILNKKNIIIISTIIILTIIFIFLILINSNNPLKGTSWTRKTDEDVEYINFYDNGNFSYYFGVGSPVDDYDLCDKYKYDKENKVINLNCNKIIIIKDRIKVDYIADDKLILIFGNEKRSFNRVNK